MEYIGLAGLLVLGILITSVTKWVLSLRRVVPSNEVHIVQERKATISYGNLSGNSEEQNKHGNTYYEWPTWMPLFGVTKISLPLSVFDLDLPDYEAYDKGRLPFKVDVKAFFRITDPNLAAQRVASYEELKGQLKAIVQGAVRTILSTNDIETIMQGRAAFGEQFTLEVKSQLANWGVETVKNIELMDIRDGNGSQVIHNIMAKKQSEIEKESRVAVAENEKLASIAEIEAKREKDISAQNALKMVGIQTAQTEQEVGIAKEASLQAIKVQQKETAQKDLDVQKLNDVTKAEITKEVQIVSAKQSKETQQIEAEAHKTVTTITAEAEKERLTLVGEGALANKKFEAEGIAVEGLAKAEAEKAILMAPVDAQITLAKEIGQNNSYQQYLISIEQVNANKVVGIEQAKALAAGELKVIVNSGSVDSGVKGIGDVFSSKGGTGFGAMLEGFANTDQGKAVLTKVLGIDPSASVSDKKPKPTKE